MARSVLVTGASTGIGRATALHLDRLGQRVFAGVRRDEDAASLRAAGTERLVPLRLDVTDAASIEAAVKQVENVVGEAGLGGLVNNAGIAVGGVLEFVDVDALRRQLEVNVVGLAAVTRAFLPLLRRGDGRVVNVSSNSGFVSTPFVGAYCASKFAVEALSDGLRRELRRWKLPVVVVQPGAIATPIWEKAQQEKERVLAGMSERARELYAPDLAAVDGMIDESAGRAIPPERVARTIATALTARRPRTRYRVGLDSQASWWLSRLLPDRALDAVLARLGGL